MTTPDRRPRVRAIDDPVQLQRAARIVRAALARQALAATPEAKASQYLDGAGMSNGPLAQLPAPSSSKQKKQQRPPRCQPRQNEEATD